MSKPRMFTGDHPDEDQTAASPRTTIVGARPPAGQDGLPPVPTGIEQLLRLAAADPDFREVLVERRDGAAAAAGVTLTAHEAAIIKAIPREQLSTMVAHVPTPSSDRRQFLQRTAASAVIALGGGAVISCEGCASTRPAEPEPTRGIRPDVPPPAPAPAVAPPPEGAPPSPQAHETSTNQPSPAVEAPPAAPTSPTASPGATADQPPAAPERAQDPRAAGGIRPDRPPPRPPRQGLTRGIRPDEPPPMDVDFRNQRRK
jgi:hypothetical protein